MSEEYNLLQFQPFTSTVNVSFWYDLARRKLDEYRLKEDPVAIEGEYNLVSFNSSANSENRAEVAASSPSQFYLEAESFDLGRDTANGVCRAPGTLYITNTSESFVNIDKKAAFDKVVNQIWDDISSGSVLLNEKLLNRFLLLSYADIKKYKFYYWFAFPALTFEEPIKSKAAIPLREHWNIQAVDSLKEAHLALGSPIYFLVKSNNNNIQLARLNEWESFSKGEENNVYLGFVDPSNLPAHPGWPLRNLLVFVAHKWKIQNIRVICFREFSGTRGESLFLDVQLPTLPEPFTMSKLKAVGWEKNAKGQLAPRYINLASTMDPVRLASSSVDLNLKLMQWRLLPSLDLPKVTSTKCLLFGAGTLGCNVARALMSWGVRNITLVDNGNVSYSNPVRQSLFDFEDCQNGGKPKAEAAANKLKAIFPGMNSVGKVLSIPMPGHPISKSEVENTKKSIQEIHDLIKEHDAIFILTDSRESRWLPTLLSAVEGKIAIDTALGFDSYLVMRHGMGKHPDSDEYNPQLGCYFCNDVVAPQNSLRDRTLDQQCTVTRPGLSSIASALAVELLIAVLHHPQGPYAPAELSREVSQAASTPLGIVPHSIRGFLTHFANLMVEGKAYDRCPACSPRIVNEYKKNPMDFLMQAFNNPTYLEDVAGLTELKQQEDNIEWEVDEEDDF